MCMLNVRRGTCVTRWDVYDGNDVYNVRMQRIIITLMIIMDFALTATNILGIKWVETKHNEEKATGKSEWKKPKTWQCACAVHEQLYMYMDSRKNALEVYVTDGLARSVLNQWNYATNLLYEIRSWLLRMSVECKEKCLTKYLLT